MVNGKIDWVCCMFGLVSIIGEIIDNIIINGMFYFLFIMILRFLVI